MAQPTLSSLHDFRRRAVCTLAVLSAVLAIALAGMAFGSSGSVNYRPPTPSFDARDIDAKALQPQHQFAFRGASRPIRLGSSSGTDAALHAFQSAQRTTAQSSAAPTLHISEIFGYLEQRTNCPRGPPLPVA
jgi:hypothetical protein